MKVVLNDVSSGFNLQLINDNFQKIASELNNKVLYRDNPQGEPNQMVGTLLDMNNNKIVNLGAPANANDAARLQDVQDAIAGKAEAKFTMYDPYKSLTSNNVQGALNQVADYIDGVPYVSLFKFMSAAQIADVTSGSPVLDTAQCFQDLVDYCYANKKHAFIPQVFAKLGKQIVSKISVNIHSDTTGSLTWTSLTDCGWHVIGTGLTRPGYGKVVLPQLIGPNDISGYYRPAKDYSAANYQGIGFQVVDCIWSTFEIQQFLGWGSAVSMNSNLGPCDNNDFKLGTIDICTRGIHLQSLAGNASPIGQSRFTAKNIFAYNAICLEAPTGSPGVFEVVIDAVKLECAEQGGMVIRHIGQNISDCRITAKAENKWFPNDSPGTTPTTWRGPLVIGDYTVGSEGGWAFSTRNTYNLSLDEFTPQAGYPIVSKVVGGGANLHIVNPNVIQNNPLRSVSLSSTQGEANYNGGLGAAEIHPVTRVKINVNALGNGGNQNFYFYHQALNPSNFNPVEIVQLDNGSDLTFRTMNNNANVPREVIVTVHNPTGAPITQEVNLWIKVNNG